MFRSISDFLQAWEYESSSTLKMLREITDASLAQRATPDTRTLGGLAWHITCSVGEMMTTATLPMANLATEEQPVPAHASDLVEAYETAAKAVGEMVPAHWNDGQLNDELPMYGENWKKGFILSVLLAHQTHHRGQMTVLMRMAGLKVPGVYGPAREEWSALGMPAPAV
jgi:uncharacterized damage-inducible protein DinB